MSSFATGSQLRSDILVKIWHCLSWQALAKAHEKDLPSRQGNRYIVITMTDSYVHCATTQILEKYFFTYQESLRKLDINFSKMFPHYQFDNFREDFESALMSAFLQV